MPLEVFPVIDDIWCFRRPDYLTCSYLVRTDADADLDASIVLVDAGMDSTGGDVIEALDRAFGKKPADVRAILLTHWHNDHAAGACELKERSKARVYYHAGDRRELTGEAASRGLRGWAAGRFPELGPFILLKGLLGEATPRPVAADQLVEDGARIERHFEVIATPGHTPGHVCFLYAPPGGPRVLFAGDALAVIGDQLRFMARPVTPDVPAARRSMEKCLARPIEHVCPGHRRPLADAGPRCREMHDRLVAGLSWPLFG